MRKELVPICEHLSDSDLLMAADGELSSNQAVQTRAHLEKCWPCRARMAELESAIGGVTLVHKKALAQALPPIEGPRALLGARLAQISAAEHGSYSSISRFTRLAISGGLLALLLIAGLFGGLAAWRARDSKHQLQSSEASLRPNHALTPGATRRVSIDEVCAMPDEEVIKDVSLDLRRRVFSEYGLSGANAENYEVDCLIALGLGGADDIHNLWPEPYRTPVWNAHVKDDLERRLHELVCAHAVDLQTAQSDIGTDWVAAYRKYFHTEQPITQEVRSLPEHVGMFIQPANKF